MSKFIQTYFFHPLTFPLLTKQKCEKINFFLSSDFSILPPFSIFPHFHSSNQGDPNAEVMSYCTLSKNMKSEKCRLIDPMSRDSKCNIYYVYQCKSGSMFMSDHPDLQKNINIYLRKELYTKLTYFDHPNKNVEHPILRIKKILVQQK